MKAVLFVALLGLCLFTSQALGQTRSQVYGTTLTKQTQAAFVQYDYGWQTYRSEAAESNATANVQSITFGGYAGESRRLGVYFSSDSSQTTFDLNNSDVATTWNMMALQL